MIIDQNNPINSDWSIPNLTIVNFSANTFLASYLHQILCYFSTKIFNNYAGTAISSRAILDEFSEEN